MIDLYHAPIASRRKQEKLQNGWSRFSSIRLELTNQLSTFWRGSAAFSDTQCLSTRFLRDVDIDFSMKHLNLNLAWSYSVVVAKYFACIHVSTGIFVSVALSVVQAVRHDQPRRRCWILGGRRGRGQLLPRFYCRVDGRLRVFVARGSSRFIRFSKFE